MLNNCYILYDSRLKEDVVLPMSFKRNFTQVFDLQKEHFERYETMLGNQHHWVFTYVYNNFLPILSEHYKFEYSLEDFILIPNVIREFDLSYLVPKEPYHFKIHLLEDNKMLEGDDSVFRKTTINSYHDVFIGAHKTCQIHNYSVTNNKYIIINCDSMSVPIIPIIARFYKYCLVLDNRNFKHPLNYKKRISQFKCSDCDLLTILIAGSDHEGHTMLQRYYHNLLIQ